MFGCGPVLIPGRPHKLAVMAARRQLRIALLGALSALAACTFAPSPAAALGSPNPVIADCLAHPGGLTGSYSVQQLRHALQVMPSETKEYTSCSDVINRALLGAIGRERGSRAAAGTGGGSGSVLPTPVVIVLVVLVLAAVTFAAVAIRRRRGLGH